MTTTFRPPVRPTLHTPPGPMGNLLLGVLPELQRDPLGLLLSLARNYGDIVKYRVSVYTGYLLNHPDYIKHVFQENNRNYDKQNFDYQILQLIVGQGLLTSDGDFWLRQRRLIQPAFHRQRLQEFGQIMTSTTQEMLERWQAPEYQQQPFDVAQEMMRLTLSVVGKALFSQDVSGAASVVGPAFSYMNEDIASRFRSIVVQPISWPTPRNRRFKAARAAMDQVVEDVLCSRRADLAAGKTPEQPDLIDMLLAARHEDTGEGMTDSQLRDEITTIMLAGHETTANALAWTWYLLGTHPQVWNSLQAELRQVLGGRAPSMADLENLSYTRMVIQEALRLYPPAWFISRHALAEDHFGPFTLPAGSVVTISPYTTHRHPRYWEDPDQFDPLRFTPERVAERPPFAYLPFGGGPRLCIGRDFAMAEAVLVLATIAQHYRLELVTGQRIEPDPLITLRPKYGVQVRLEKL